MIIPFIAIIVYKIEKKENQLFLQKSLDSQKNPLDLKK